jgi:hypothetical protein
MTLFPKDDPANRDRSRVFMGPGQVDHQIRQAIQFSCVMLAPGYSIPLF